jgi:hypothetical protein
VILNAFAQFHADLPDPTAIFFASLRALGTTLGL